MTTAPFFPQGARITRIGRKRTSSLKCESVQLPLIVHEQFQSRRPVRSRNGDANVRSAAELTLQANGCGNERSHGLRIGRKRTSSPKQRIGPTPPHRKPASSKLACPFPFSLRFPVLCPTSRSPSCDGQVLSCSHTQHGYVSSSSGSTSQPSGSSGRA